MKVKCLVVLLILLLGCVSSKDYKERLLDIENFKSDVFALEEKLKAKETENAGMRDKVLALEKEVLSLRDNISILEEGLSAKEKESIELTKEKDELIKKKIALEEDNSNLNRLLEAKKDALSKEIVSLKARLSESEQQIEGLKKEILSISEEKAKAIGEKEKAISELKKTYDSLVKEMGSEIKKGEIAITQLRDKLSLSMVEKILFDSGSAEIKKDGEKVLERVGAILKKVKDKQIKVEGHTDNVPISVRLRKRFPTNWELSTARATNVLRYLQETAGIDPRMLIATGYAEYKPVKSNDTEEGRAKNRRIEIVLIPMGIE